MRRYLIENVDTQVAEIYWNLYYHSNQFCWNEIHSSHLALFNLANRPIDSDYSSIAATLRISEREVTAMINGEREYKPYYTLDSNEDKLKVTQFLEDQYLEVLYSLAGNS